MEVTSNEGVVTNEVSVNEESIPQDTTQTNETTPTEGTQTEGTQTQQNTETSGTNTSITQSDVDSINATENALQKDLEARGVDFTAVENEYLQNGSLSNETQSKLTQAGYPKEVIDNYIRNVEREANAFVSTVQSYVGNEQEWNTFVSFVQSQGDTAINLFNDAINTGNLGIIQATVGQLKTQMVNTYGTNNPTLMSGGSATGAVHEGFASSYEMQEAMSDKRYGRDRAYTQMVEQKVINSKFDY